MHAEIQPRRDRYSSTENTCSVHPALLENANWKAGVLTLLHFFDNYPHFNETYP